MNYHSLSGRAVLLWSSYPRLVESSKFQSDFSKKRETCMDDAFALSRVRILHGSQKPLQAFTLCLNAKSLSVWAPVMYANPWGDESTLTLCPPVQHSFHHSTSSKVYDIACRESNTSGLGTCLCPDTVSAGISTEDLQCPPPSFCVPKVPIPCFDVPKVLVHLHPPNFQRTSKQYVSVQY